MFNLSNLMDHAIALQRGPRSCSGPFFLIIFFFGVVCFLVFVSLWCLLFFTCGVNAYYCFLCIATIPSTLLLSFLCATIVTCFGYLLFHISIVIVVFLYVISICNIFTFCIL